MVTRNQKEVGMHAKRSLEEFVLNLPKEDMIIQTMDTPDNELAVQIDYIGAHALLPKDCDKFPIEKIKDMGLVLLANTPEEIIAKTIVMILAHHPSREALNILRMYLSKANTDLKAFVQCAIEECEVWNNGR